MKCLFLGYNSKQTKLINFLRKNKISVTNKKSKVSENEIGKYDLIISFGYRKMIRNSVLRKAKRPILNLHMSYLPYNKGAHPNFWSFYDNTKKGITIHEIDKSLDTGPIVYQKEIKFNILKNKKISFKKTYNILFLELEKLFIKNFTSIILNNYKKKINIKSKGKIRKKRDLPGDLENWDVSVYKYLNDLLAYKKISNVVHQKLIWKINNDKESRKYSRNKKSFSYKHHLKWFKETLNKKKELIYLAKKDEKIIGIIRSKKINKELFLSWALVKKFRGKNFGTRLVKEFVNKKNVTFFAEVHKKNIKSIKICNKTGFKFLRKENDFLIFKRSISAYTKFLSVHKSSQLSY